MLFQHLLFVYGSLKRGENDYPYWLADPEEVLFIGDAMTTKPYPLYVTLIPEYKICEPCLENIDSCNAIVNEKEVKEETEHKNMVDIQEICRKNMQRKSEFVLNKEKCVKWSKMQQCVHGELFAITAKMKAWLDIFYSTFASEQNVVNVQVDTNDNDNVNANKSNTDNSDSNDDDYKGVLHSSGSDNDDTLQLKWTCADINVQLFISRRRAKRIERLTSFALDKEVKAITYFAARSRKHNCCSCRSVCHNTNEGTICSYDYDYMNRFSAVKCLERYGARFNNGKPRHLLYDDETRRRVNHRFMSLPPDLQPKSCLWQEQSTNSANKNVMNIEKDNEEQGGEETCVCNIDERCHKRLPIVSCAHKSNYCVTLIETPISPAPIVLFIIDGVGDNTYVELGNRTPLEVVAHVPPRERETEATASQRTSHEALPEPQGRLDVHALENKIGGKERAYTRSTNVPNSTREYTQFCSCLECFVEDGINTLTRHGVSGLMDPYMAGMSCGSDTAHLSMFGYPPLHYYRGRGAYEALGAGLTLDDDDVAFKSNFATLEDTNSPHMNTEVNNTKRGLNRRVLHRRCDRDFTKEGPILCRDLNNTLIDVDENGVPFAYPHRIKIQYATEHRCGVALSGPCTKLTDHGTCNDNTNNNKGQVRKVKAEATESTCEEDNDLGVLSDKISGTDPLKDNRELIWCTPTVGEGHPEYAAALYTSRLVNAASAKLTKLLSDHPINVERREYNDKIAFLKRENVMHQSCTKHNDNNKNDVSPVSVACGSERELHKLESNTRLVENERLGEVNVTKQDIQTSCSCATNTTIEVNNVNERVSQTNKSDIINSPTCFSKNAHCWTTTDAFHLLPTQTEQTEMCLNSSRQDNDVMLEEKKNLANVILFRGAAKKGWVPSFAARHGLIGAIIAPTCIIKGLGLCCGLSSKICGRKKTTGQKNRIEKIKTTYHEYDTVPNRVEFPEYNEFKESKKILEEYEEQHEEEEHEHEEVLQYHEENNVKVQEKQDEIEDYFMLGATGDVHSDLMVKVRAALCAIYGHCIDVFHINNGKGEENKRTDMKEEYIVQDNVVAEREEFVGPSQSAYNFVVIHVKGVDDAGHDKSLYNKLNMLNKCGKAMKALWDALPDNATMGVVADHSTPIWIGDHCCEPVPISIATKSCKTSTNVANKHKLPETAINGNNNPMTTEVKQVRETACRHESHECNSQKQLALKEDRVLHDNVEYYSEVEARCGALGRFRGEELIDVMKKLHYFYHYY